QPQMPARRFECGWGGHRSAQAQAPESEAEAAGQKNQIPSRKPNFTKQQPAWHQPAGCSRSRGNGARKRQSSAHKEDSADKVRQQTKPQQNSPQPAGRLRLGDWQVKRQAAAMAGSTESEAEQTKPSDPRARHR
ncbi:hypothetical protein, partial [Mesorhizobium sp. WSM1293]|uniref:hypothetical protein n=1 Tax=Mesorhizobium sp. WSM1293 TaxID=1040984 RepID=UPI001AEC43E3